MNRLAPLCLFLLIPVGCADEDALPPPEAEIVDPGTLVMHRLNRAEYDNTVRDLLGTTLVPARDFPEDDLGYGFDNISAVLSTSPLHVELYERAADLLLAEVLTLPSDAPPIDRLVEVEDEEVTKTNGGIWGTDGWNLWSNGEAAVEQEVALPGTYRLTARLAATQGGPDLAHAELRVDDVQIVGHDVAAVREFPEEYSGEFEVIEGNRKFAVAFTNDFYDQETGEDRNLLVDWFRIEGPLGWSPDPNPARAGLVPCTPETPDEEDACLREVLTTFLPRAFRRPVSEAEIEVHVGLIELARAHGEGFEAGLNLALKAALLSPHFLYRVEVDASPDDPTVHVASQHELASRLSYFLWSSMPDATLFAAADGGTLDADGLAGQARRMLADPRAEALVDNFAGQWLYIRALEDVSPDVWAFPEFDEELRTAMSEEMQIFFRTFLRDGRPLSQLLSSPGTSVNARLAAHYGIEGDFTDAFEPVVPGDRLGLLGMAGLLTATSYPTRTSPVKRGEWVLAQLLCSEPEPPPPGVEGLPEGVDQDLPLRERLEQHRADPECSGCHAVMDQIGFGLEHFNGVGSWRDDEDGLPIDASGVLPGDVTFEGAVELAAVLAENPWLDVCMTRQLMTYALGRGTFVEDRAVVDSVAAGYVEDGGRLEDLVVRIVRSDAFRLRRGGSNSGRGL